MDQKTTHTKQLADKIVDTDYKNSKNKNPFTQVAENAVKELSFTMRDGHIENNEGTSRLKGAKEAIKINEALDKNFQDQKTDDYLKSIKPKLQYVPILNRNINNIAKTNPTVQRYKDFKEDKKFRENFEKDYGEKAIEQHIRGKENKNRMSGKAPYENFSSSELIVAEHAKDKAKARLKAIQTPHTIDPHIQGISKSITDLQNLRKEIDEIDLKRKFDEARRKKEDPDKYRGIGSILSLGPKRYL